MITESPTGRGQQIDVDVFTDPVSGKSYLYWGNGYMAGAELNKDMVSIKKKTLAVLTPEGGTLQDYAYREAPYVFYRNGLYYFMWSVDDTGSPNYHVACKPGTDEWYIVYHRINKHYLDKSLSPGTHREVCIDRLEFNADGTIKRVELTK